MKLLSISEIENFKNDIDDLTLSAYPEYLLYDPISVKYWDELYKLFPEYQKIYHENNQILAVGNSTPIYIKNYDNFFIDGWDWALEQAVIQHNANIKPNTLVGLSVVVNNDFQGKGISKEILSDFKKTAIESHFERMIIPIRPIKKHLYPFMDLEEYIDQRVEGIHIDPWIRIHESLGAKIICICKNAMVIPGSITEWESWTGLKLLKTGKYHIRGGLNPLEVDIKNNSCLYTEPNIWMQYLLKN